MISECLGRRSKGLFWTSNFSAFRACIQLQNYIPELFVQVAAVRFEEGFCVLQKEHWQGWEWGVCSWGEGCLLHHTLELLQSCAARVTVLVWADTAVSRLVRWPSWRNQSSRLIGMETVPESRFSDWEHGERTFVKYLPYGISSSQLFRVALGVLFLQLGLREVKQFAEDCLHDKWQTWFSNPGLLLSWNLCSSSYWELSSRQGFPRGSQQVG